MTSLGQHSPLLHTSILTADMKIFRLRCTLFHVTNKRTGVTATDVVQRDYFAAAFGDLTRKSVVQDGDVIAVSILDAAGRIIGEPTTYTVFIKIFCVETSCFSPGWKRSFLLSITVGFVNIICFLPGNFV